MSMSSVVLVGRTYQNFVNSDEMNESNSPHIGLGFAFRWLIRLKGGNIHTIEEFHLYRYYSLRVQF